MTNAEGWSLPHIKLSWIGSMSGDVAIDLLFVEVSLLSVCRVSVTLW